MTTPQSAIRNPQYDDALALFHAWTEGESLRRHAYAVEAAMRQYAEEFGLPPEEVERWRIAGLLHDMDYERHPTPEEHPFVGVAELDRRGYDEEIRQAILGHALYSGVPRESLMAKTLFAVDELAGFVTAVAHVRPEGLAGMTPKSVKKKLKDKRFAAAVSREDIARGAEELGVEMDAHIATVIAGMEREAKRLGFA
ncbi:MAG TPA: HD domain-containing protein [Rubricoccaceae bacterium]|nr:HD domain-containing protein [Rubricoccaceae bacterium]